MLGWLVGRDITPHIPVKDQSEIASKGSFVRADFDYDEKQDVYICATGKTLTTTGRVFSGNTLYYRARLPRQTTAPASSIAKGVP